MRTTKICPSCDEVKPLETFGLTPSKNGKSYPHSYCKQCRATRETMRKQKLKEIKEWAETTYSAKRNPCFTCPVRIGCREECSAFVKYLAVG